MTGGGVGGGVCGGYCVVLIGLCLLASLDKIKCC